jgi:hypothetical protein
VKCEDNYSLIGSEAIEQEIGHFGVKMQSGGASAYSVVLVGVNRQVKGLIGLYQGIAHLYAVLEMNIIIGSSVNQEVGTLERCYMVDR